MQNSVFAFGPLREPHFYYFWVHFGSTLGSRLVHRCEALRAKTYDNGGDFLPVSLEQQLRATTLLQLLNYLMGIEGDFSIAARILASKTPPRTFLRPSSLQQISKTLPPRMVQMSMGVRVRMRVRERMRVRARVKTRMSVRVRLTMRVRVRVIFYCVLLAFCL